MYDPSIEHALDGDGFSPDHRPGVLAPRTKVDERTTAAVVDGEHVAEDLGHAAKNGGWTSGLQRVDGGWLQQHDAPRPPILGKSHPAGPQRSAGDQHKRETARREATRRDGPTAPRRWCCFWSGRIFTIGHDRRALVIVVDVRTVPNAAKSTLNRTVQLELS
jgi:hypothetical protein